MATGVLISSFVYPGTPVLSGIFGFFKSSSGVQIQRLQITAATVPVGGNITVQLVDESGNAYAGATVTLPSGTGYYDQPLVAPITLGLGKIVRAQITAVDLGVANGIVVNLMGATAQGSNAPSGCCGPQECQPPTAQLLFFQGSVQNEVAAAQAAAAASAASAVESADSATESEASAVASAASATGAEGSATAAAASVVQAANWATNANNAATAASVFAANSAASAGASASSASAAAVSATAAALSALAAQSGIQVANAQLTTGSVQSLADATPTAVIWNNASVNDLFMWDAGNPTRLTITPGRNITHVKLCTGLRWAANTTGERKLKIRSNPVGIHPANSFWASDDRPSDATGDATLTTGIIAVEDGMYFEVIAEQNSGGALAINTTGAVNNSANFFSIEVLKRTP